jgi:hypothetical protein
MRCAALIIALWALGPAVFAQDERTRSLQWSIGFSGSVDRSHRALVKKGSDSNLDRIIDLRDSVEIPALGFSYGVSARLDPSPRIWVRMDLRMSRLGYASKPMDAIILDPADPALGSLGKVEWEWNYHFFALPVVAGASMGGERFRFEPGVGVGIDHLRRAEATYELTFADGRRQRITNKDTVNDYAEWCFSALLELNASWTPSSRIAIGAGPRASYQLNELVDAPITAHLYAIGAGFSARYSLRR